MNKLNNLFNRTNRMFDNRTNRTFGLPNQTFGLPNRTFGLPNRTFGIRTSTVIVFLWLSFSKSSTFAWSLKCCGRIDPRSKKENNDHCWHLNVFGENEEQNLNNILCLRQPHAKYGKENYSEACYTLSMFLNGFWGFEVTYFWLL